jgi:hypothetical protein
MRKCLCTLGLAVLFSLSACGSNGGGGGGDGSTKNDSNGTVTPTKLSCNADMSNCKDFVFNQLFMPTDSKKFGLQIDGVSYNALGSILNAVATDMSVQDAMTEYINEGTTLILARIQAKDFANDPAALGQAWIGNEETCCTDPKDTVKCAQEAVKTCFKGDYQFTPDPAGPQDAIISGTITNGKLDMKTNNLLLNLPMSSAGTIPLKLKSVRIKGTLSGTTITGGVLAGAIDKNDVNNTLIPAIAKVMDEQYKNPTTPDPEKTKKTLKPFDENNNGEITSEELKSGIGNLLSGDVDVDKDGVMDLSVGVGFEAISAAINAK